MIVSSTDQRVRRKRPRRRDPEFDGLPDLVNTETGSVVDNSESDDRLRLLFRRKFESSES